MITFTKRVTSTLSYLGSATASRRGMKPLRGILSFLSPSSSGAPRQEARPRRYAGEDPCRVLARRRALLRLRAVLRATLLAPAHTTRVQRPAHDVVAHSRQILHAAPADEHDRVLLQVVTFARDVAGHLDAIRESNARHLAQRRVRLLGRSGVHASAHATLLRTRLQRRRARFALHPPPPMADELAQGRHRKPPTSSRLWACAVRQATASAKEKHAPLPRRPGNLRLCGCCVKRFLPPRPLRRPGRSASPTPVAGGGTPACRS